METTLERAHKFSSKHAEMVKKSEECGCFHCGTWFPPAQIKEWIDGGQTAMCPKCGIDSVIGDASMKGTDIVFDDLFLSEMRRHWFNYG